ncbi:MAG: hypothetical protein QXI19_08490, partial [Candidatus Caldarchaeum sp.]
GFSVDLGDRLGIETSLEVSREEGLLVNDILNPGEQYRIEITQGPAHGTLDYVSDDGGFAIGHTMAILGRTVLNTV